MKLSICFSAVVVTIASILLVNTGYAEDKIQAHHSFLLTNNYNAMRVITFDSLSNTYSETFLPKHITSLQGGFTKGIISIKTGKITSENLTDWSKYYLNSAITIHQSAVFNLSITASVEQFKNSNLSSQLQPLTNGSQQFNETELNYSYGIMGSYSVNPTWYFSGGIVHSSPINEANNTSWNTNSSMALIGTTYSF